MNIRIELIGALQGKAVKKGIIEIGEGAIVSTLIGELVKILDDNTSILLDDVQSLKPNFLILVNEKEINVLNGFETILYKDDKVTIIPVSHGG